MRRVVHLDHELAWLCDQCNRTSYVIICNIQIKYYSDQKSNSLMEKIDRYMTLKKDNRSYPVAHPRKLYPNGCLTCLNQAGSQRSASAPQHWTSRSEFLHQHLSQYSPRPRWHPRLFGQGRMLRCRLLNLSR